MVAFPSAVAALGVRGRHAAPVEEHNRAGPGPPLEVRVGLHAGEPVRDGDDFHGEAVVVAKRLCDLAGGGQILTSELVAGLVGSRGGFRFRPLGHLPLKGLPRRVATVALEWEPTASTAPVAPRRRVTPGRSLPARPGGARSWSAGTGSWRSSRRSSNGRSPSEFGCVLLLGEPGVGKTRLAGELLARHRKADAIGLSARAYPSGRPPPSGCGPRRSSATCGRWTPTRSSGSAPGSLDDLAGLLRSVAGPARDPDPSAGAAPQPPARCAGGAVGNLAADQPVVVADRRRPPGRRFVAGGAPLPGPAAAPAPACWWSPPPGRRSWPSSRSAADTVLGLEQDGLLRRLCARAARRRRPARRWPRSMAGESGPGRPGRLARGALPGQSALRHRAHAGPARRGGGSLRPGAARGSPRRSRSGWRAASATSTAPPSASSSSWRCSGRRVELRSLVALVGRDPRRAGRDPRPLVRARLRRPRRSGGSSSPTRSAHPLVAEAIYEGIGAGRRRRLHRQVGPGPGLRRPARRGGPPLRPLGRARRRRGGRGAARRHPPGRGGGRPTRRRWPSWPRWSSCSRPGTPAGPTWSMP